MAISSQAIYMTELDTVFHGHYLQADNVHVTAISTSALQGKHTML